MNGFTGDELFHDDGTFLDFSISDFWRWAFGNLLDNTKRGALAEYIIQRALELDTSGTQADWGAFDILYNDKRIEVKSAAYVQAWNLDNEKYSNISFSIRPTHAWNDSTNTYSNSKMRNNELYIFAVYEELDKLHVDVSDLSKWSFYVVPTRLLNSVFPTQQTITLNTLLNKVKPTRYGWFELKSAVDNLQL